METTHTTTLLYILMDEWRHHSLACLTLHCL
nr:MAG TPA: hypothetical protein [Crassvirales sp.]